MARRSRWGIVRLTVVAVLLTAAPVRAPADAVPVAVGRLEYRLSWNGIPAADATVDVARDGEGPAPRYRVVAVARTGWLVDWLWRLRARATSSFTADGFAPLGFRYDRETNNESGLTDVTFDPGTAQATGTYRHRGKTDVVAVQEADVVDPITAIFRALSQSVQTGDTLRYEVFTGEARYRVVLRIIGEEPMRVAAGTFKAWKVEPQVWKIGKGPDQRLRHATVWVSQEPIRALLRIRSEVFIGAVNCDLLRFAPPAPSAGAW